MDYCPSPEMEPTTTKILGMSRPHSNHRHHQSSITNHELPTSMSKHPHGLQKNRHRHNHHDRHHSHPSPSPWLQPSTIIIMPIISVSLTIITNHNKYCVLNMSQNYFCSEGQLRTHFLGTQKIKGWKQTWMCKEMFHRHHDHHHPHEHHWIITVSFVCHHCYRHLPSKRACQSVTGIIEAKRPPNHMYQSRVAVGQHVPALRNIDHSEPRRMIARILSTHDILHLWMSTGKDARSPSSCNNWVVSSNSICNLVLRKRWACDHGSWISSLLFATEPLILTVRDTTNTSIRIKHDFPWKRSL